MVKITLETGESQIFAFWTDESSNKQRMMEGAISHDIGAWKDEDATADFTNFGGSDYAGPVKMTGSLCNPEAGSIILILANEFNRKNTFTVTTHTDETLPTVQGLTGQARLM